MNRWAAAGAGGVALPLAVGMMHPLDTVRTTMQATQTRGFSDALRSLGSRGIARGFGLSFLWASPQGAIRMASYETCKDQLLDKCYAKSFGIAVSAVLADFASSVIKVPRELITQRLQTGQYLSSWTAFQSILRQDGLEVSSVDICLLLPEIHPSWCSCFFRMNSLKLGRYVSLLQIVTQVYY